MSDLTLSSHLLRPRIKGARCLVQGELGRWIRVDPVQETSGRKRLGGESKGTSTLFGDARTDYNQSSQNGMIPKPKKVANFEQRA